MLNAPTTPRTGCSGQSQDVGEHRVVVQAEIGPLVEREDPIRVERRTASVNQFVPEDPGVPDVDAGVASRGSGEMREQPYR